MSNVKGASYEQKSLPNIWLKRNRVDKSSKRIYIHGNGIDMVEVHLI